MGTSTDSLKSSCRLLRTAGAGKAGCLALICTFIAHGSAMRLSAAETRVAAMTVIYPSPLLVLCDSPQNNHGRPSLAFLRAIPTVRDETVVISGEVGKSIIMARRAGEKWYLAAMNGDDAAQLPVSLSYLGKGQWELPHFADRLDGSDYPAVLESKQSVTAKSTLSLATAGGYAETIVKTK